MADFIYDIETFPNIFTIGIRDASTGDRFLFEISWRKNEIVQLMQFLSYLKSQNHRMVGYNNIGFDYPVIHHIIMNQSYISPLSIYQKADSIINCDFHDRFSHIIWDRDRHVEQLDLFKIHHFDNPAKSTSLKIIEFNMRMEFIEDLPFKPGTLLDWKQCDDLISYMWHDIKATYDFYLETEKQIKFREDLTQKYNRSFMNHNDTKIGKEYFIMELERQVPGFDKKRKTPRNSIKVSDIIFPYIKFNDPGFNRILSWFKDQTITDTKKAFKDVECSYDGFTYVFGTGGIHGSVEPCIVEANENYDIIDIDVASYYPNIAIQNKLYPEHLGQKFCDIYNDVYQQRKQHKKGTVENAMLKLALNGVYGDSNNIYSPFYDPQYTMSITINGQLLLCMLAERLQTIQGVHMIQINTDGMTIKCRKKIRPYVISECNFWEKKIGLELEYADYSKMFIRDVNNYIAVYTDGNVKRKGAYEYNRGWHQDHSAMIVPKAVERHLVHSEDIRTVIENHTDVYDFMLRTKVPRSSKLVTVGYDGIDKQVQNVSRYYISVMGSDLVKIMPPLKGKTEDRRIGINTGWKVSVCNDIKDCNPDDIETEWYIKEAEKLIKPLKG